MATLTNSVATLGVPPPISSTTVNTVTALWRAKIGSTGAVADLAEKMVVDSTGVYIIMTADVGTVNIFTIADVLQTTYTNSGSSTDVIIIKYSLTGTYLWSTRAVSTAADTNCCIAANGKYMYAVISYAANLALYNAGGVLAATCTVTGASQNSCIVQYNATSGAVVAYTVIASVDNNLHKSLAIDGSGVYVSGPYSAASCTVYSSAATPLGAPVSAGSLAVVTATDIFVVKFTQELKMSWMTRITGAGVTDASYSAYTDATNLYLTGTFNSATLTVYNGPSGTATTLATLAGGSGFSFVVAYNCVTGVGAWATRSSATAPLIGKGITAYSGAVYVCGNFTGTLTSYDAPGTSATMATMASISATQDAFVTAYNATTGAVTFQAKIATTGSDTGEDIYADVTGVYVTGGYSGTMSVYDSPGSSVVLPTVAASTGSDAYIVKFNSSLAGVWATRIIGTSTGEIGNSVRVLDGNVYNLGIFNSGSITFYDPPGTVASPGVSALSQTVPASPATGGSDVYIVRYNNVNSSTVTGNLVVSGTSTVTLSAASITNAMITAGAVDTTKIFAGTIQNEDFAAATIATGNIAAATLTTGLFVANTITGAQVAVNTITSANILDATIATSNIGTATIANAKFAGGSILAGNIVASTVAAVDIAGATGSILVGNGTSMTALAIGTAGQTLAVSGGTAVWSSTGATDMYASEVLSLVASGGTAIDTTKTHSIVDLNLTESGDIVGDWRASVTNRGTVTFGDQFQHNAVCVDSTGLYAAYTYSHSVDVTPYDGTDAAGSTYTLIGTTEVIIVKYSLTGSISWQTRMTVPVGQTVRQPSIGSDGTNVYVAVAYTGTLTLYNAPGTVAFGTTLAVVNAGTSCCALIEYVASTGAVGDITKITTSVAGVGIRYPCIHVSAANVAIVCVLESNAFTGNVTLYNGPVGTASASNIAFTTTTGGCVVARYSHALLRQNSSWATGPADGRLGIHTDDTLSLVFIAFSHNAAVVVPGGGSLLANASIYKDDAIVTFDYAAMALQRITKVARTSSTAGGPALRALTGDASNLYMTGDLYETGTFYDGGATTIGASYGSVTLSSGCYIVKCTKAALAGAFLTKIGNATMLSCVADSTGLYMCGLRVNINVTAYNAPGTTATLSDYSGTSSLIFVKYDLTGIAQYITTGSGFGTFYGTGVATLNNDIYITAIDTSDNASMVRTFYDPPGTGATLATATIPTTRGGQFIVRYRSAVLPRGEWRSVVGGTLAEGGATRQQGMCADYSGVYMITTTASATCGLYSTADVLYGNAPALVGTLDTILVKYNTAGVIQWYTRFASTGASVEMFQGRSLVSNGKYLYVGVILSSGTAAAILLYNAVAPGVALGASVASTPATFVSAIIRLRCDTGAISIYAGTSRGHLGSALGIDSSGVYINQRSATSPVTIYNGPTGAATAGSMAVANVLVIVKWNLDLIAQWWTNISNITPVMYQGVCSDGLNVYVNGWMPTGNSTINDGPTGAVSTLAVINSAVSQSMIIAAFNCFTGVGYWGTKIGVTAGTFAYVDIAVYGDSIYVVSNFNSTLTAYNAPGSVSSGRSVTDAGGQDTVIAKYNKNTGTNTFLTKIGGANSNGTCAVLADESGFYVSGDSDASLVYAYDPTGVTQNTTVGPVPVTSGFIFKYDYSGNAVWLASTSGGGRMAGIAVYAGDVYVSGHTSSAVSNILDPNMTSSSLAQIPLIGGTDAFVIKFAVTPVYGRLTMADGAASSLMHDVIVREYTKYNANMYTNLQLSMTTAVDNTFGGAITKVILPSKGASVSLAWNGTYWVIVNNTNNVVVRT